VIFRYPGGKSKKSIREGILDHFPLSYDEARFPFVGGGGIFFHVPTNKKRWINDVDRHLISVYQALRDRPDDFINKCRKISPHSEKEATQAVFEGRKVYNVRMRKIFDKFAHNDKMDQALRFFYINKTVFGGRVNYDIDSRLYFSNPPGWSIVKTNKLEKAAKILQNTKITSYDYSRLLKGKKKKKVLLYLDPPYLLNTNLTKTSQLYRYNFSVKDHKKLSETVKKCHYHVIMSYDDDDEGFIRSLYDGFNVYTTEWTYCGSSSGKNQSKIKRKGKELIITNYKKQLILDLFSR